MVKSHILKVVKSQLARHISVVLTGNIFAAGLGFISLLLITKGLSISEFGLFTICIALLRILPLITCFGMDTSMVTHASSCLARGQHNKANEILRAGLLFRAGSSLLIGLILVASTPYIAKHVFHYPTLKPMLIVTALGVFFVSMFHQVKSAFYTYKRFKNYIIALVTTDVVKLSSILLLIASGAIGPVSAAAVFGIAPLAGVAWGIWIFRHQIYSRTYKTRLIMQNLIPYSKWIFLSAMSKITFSYMGTFMLVKLLDAKAAGIFGLALNLTYIIPILTNSFSSVLLPEISRFHEISQFEKHLKISLRISSYIAATVIACLIFSGKFIIFFFGIKYARSVVIFNWLILSYLVQAVNATLLSPMLYSLKKNHIVALADLTKLILMFIGCFFFIPVLGIPGPAILALILNVVFTSYLLIYVLKHIDRIKTASPLEAYRPLDIPTP